MPEVFRREPVSVPSDAGFAPGGTVWPTAPRRAILSIRI